MMDLGWKLEEPFELLATNIPLMNVTCCWMKPLSYILLTDVWNWSSHLENFAKFTKKHLHQVSDFIKKGSVRGPFVWILPNFSEQLFWRTNLNIYFYFLLHEKGNDCFCGINETWFTQQCLVLKFGLSKGMNLLSTENSNILLSFKHLRVLLRIGGYISIFKIKYLVYHFFLDALEIFQWIIQ